MILIIIGVITLLFPFCQILVSTFSLIDSFNSKILPSSVRFDERNFTGIMDRLSYWRLLCYCNRMS